MYATLYVFLCGEEMLLSLLIPSFFSCLSIQEDVRLAPVVPRPPPALRRLTNAQYKESIASLFGMGLVLPTRLEPDVAVDGLRSIGASVTMVSPSGVSDYEKAAYEIIEQVLADEERVARLLPCTPSSPNDALCAEQFVQTFGRKVWRRPLTEEEVTEITHVLTSIGEDSNG